jgi:hypothetical protein
MQIRSNFEETGNVGCAKCSPRSIYHYLTLTNRGLRRLAGLGSLVVIRPARTLPLLDHRFHTFGNSGWPENEVQRPGRVRQGFAILIPPLREPHDLPEWTPFNYSALTT